MTQIKPPLYKIPDQRDSFYAAEDLKIFNPMFFEGTSKGIRKIIEKKSIPEQGNDYTTKRNGYPTKRYDYSK